MDEAATIQKDIKDWLQLVNRSWLFEHLYSSRVIEKTDMDKQDLTPLCDAVEKNIERNLPELIKILKTDPTHSHIVDKFQAKYSKWS